jgi:ABC-type transporter Mla MlaB component
MSKEDSGSGGLLSKMVRFVRNPTVNWSELDSIEADRESQYSKQMLKEMIERKRRNDFVRRREFDQLRKLRKREALTGQRTEDPTARPSFFQSSMTSPDERASTLKKIDEIEAQMSQQWWKGKAEGVSASASGILANAPTSAAFAPTAPLSVPSPLASPAPGTAPDPLFSGDSLASLPPHEPTEPMALEPYAPPPTMAPVAVAVEIAPEPEVFVHEPDLEEAAIRFASGDPEGAEAVLVEVLAQHAQDEPQQQLEIWMTLFDLYRATGRQDRFEAHAIDFAARFNRSAPMWFSLPEQLGVAQASTAATDSPPAGARQFHWSAPGTVTQQTLAALQATLARTPSPWTFAWSRLMAIDESALPGLAALFNSWADQDLQVAFTGVEALHSLLESKAQSGDREASPDWWRLRMATLRLMGRVDEFELVALDYCVTYEVSPPSWVVPRCSFSADDGTVSGGVAMAAPDSELMPSTFSLSVPAPIEPEGPRPTLSGYIDGDAGPMLEPLGEMARPGMPLAIACDQLIRVDFAAAGSVLNWAASQQGSGHAVQFVNLHRLVAVLFNVIGINEHARVVPRKN